MPVRSFVLLMLLLTPLALAPAPAPAEPPLPMPGPTTAVTPEEMPQRIAQWREQAEAMAEDYQATRLAEQKTDQPEENRRLRGHLLELRRAKAMLLGEMAAAQPPAEAMQEIERLLTPIPPVQTGYR